MIVFFVVVPEVTPVYQQIQYFVNEEDLDFEICVAIVSPSANMLTVASTEEVTFEPGGSASMSVMNYLLHRKYITALSLFFFFFFFFQSQILS